MFSFMRELLQENGFLYLRAILVFPSANNKPYREGTIFQQYLTRKRNTFLPEHACLFGNEILLLGHVFPRDGPGQSVESDLKKMDVICK